MMKEDREEEQIKGLAEAKQETKQTVFQAAVLKSEAFRFVRDGLNELIHKNIAKKRIGQRVLTL